MLNVYLANSPYFQYNIVRKLTVQEMILVRIYLDNYCYNRPYDDQTQLRISLESPAYLHI